MRLVAVILPTVFLCATGLSQTIPVNMGLWEVTSRTEATVPSELTAAMKKDGLTGEPLLPMRTVSPPVIQKAKSCMNEAQWVKDEAVVAKAPQNCILVSRSQDAQGMSDRLKCNAG